MGIMLKRIILPLDASMYSEAAIDYAIYIAKKQRATLFSLTIMDMPDVEDDLSYMPIGGFYWAEKAEREKIIIAEEKLEQIIIKFIKKLEDENIKFGIEKVQGIPSNKIIEYSQFYDIVILGMRSFYNYNLNKDGDKTLVELLKNSITPVFAVPDKFQSIKNVLIAYDGSFASSRAIQRFSHLASVQNFNITLISSHSEKTKTTNLQKQAVDYLKSYGIDNIKCVYTSNDIKEEIKNHYLDWSNLIVLGVHSKNIFKEFLVGSLTKELINLNQKPLFIGF